MMIKKEISKAEKTRQYIVEKSAPIFNKKGYAATSLSDLTSITGLTKGAIYGNFENKDEIAAEAFEFNLASISDVINLTKLNETDPIKKLLFIPKFYRENAVAISKVGGCPILNTSVEVDDNSNLLYKRVQQVINNWKNNIEATINKGKAQGKIKKEISSSQYATVIISLIEGGIMLARIMNDPSHLMLSLDKIESLILEAAKWKKSCLVIYRAV